MRRHLIRHAFGACAALTVIAACAATLEPGELGTPRIMGQVRGAAPLGIIPPSSDREGNVYVLVGAIDEPLETRVLVGRAGGGWIGSCKVTKGDAIGAHGWVGGRDNQLWYWSGGALVGVNGRTGDCRPVLDTDPSTGASLDFIGVIPNVLDTPSRTKVSALIKSPSDRRPFFVSVDLRANIYVNLEEFAPGNAENVRVIGTGANREERQGVTVLAFEQGLGGPVTSAAYFTDEDGSVIGAQELPLPPDLPPYAIRGFIEFNDSGTGAGVLEDGRMLVLSGAGGVLLDTPGLQAIGVHRWEGDLYVVGTVDGRPAFAGLADNGALGPPLSWTTSEKVAARLAGALDLVDDRTLPSRDARWNGAVSAIGPAPFLGAHSLDRWVDGTTGWVIAGPSFDVGGEPVTQVAFVPIGVEYR